MPGFSIIYIYIYIYKMNTTEFHFGSLETAIRNCKSHAQKQEYHKAIAVITWREH